MHGGIVTNAALIHICCDYISVYFSKVEMLYLPDSTEDCLLSVYLQTTLQTSFRTFNLSGIWQSFFELHVFTYTVKTGSQSSSYATFLLHKCILFHRNPWDGFLAQRLFFHSSGDSGYSHIHLCTYFIKSFGVIKTETNEKSLAYSKSIELYM